MAALQAGQVDEDGVEEAFEVITDINERYENFIPLTWKDTYLGALACGPGSGWATALSIPTPLIV